MKDKYSKISDDLRIWRKEAGLTQQDLAEKTGISLSSISKYERGIRLPKVEQLNKILSALGIKEVSGNEEISTEKIYEIEQDDLTFMFQESVTIIENLSPKYIKKTYEYLLDLERLDKLDKENR